jgi:hypothetical protein
MFRAILLATLALTLCACSTKGVVTDCNPPPSLLEPAAPLPAVPLDRMTLPEVIQQWNRDAGQYRALANRHDTLSNWIGDRC